MLSSEVLGRKEVAGRPREVLSTAWGMGTIKSLISASGAGVVRTVGWGVR
jgi:hypothetical protein